MRRDGQRTLCSRARVVVISSWSPVKRGCFSALRLHVSHFVSPVLLFTAARSHSLTHSLTHSHSLAHSFVFS